MKRVGLFDYQKAGVSRILSVFRETTLQTPNGESFKPKGFLLGDEMGLGKTVQALEVVKELGGNALVVCPASCIGVWKEETSKSSIDLTVFDGKQKTLAGLCLVSYETLLSFYKSYFNSRHDISGFTNEEMLRLCRMHGKSLHKIIGLSGDELRRELIDIIRPISVPPGPKKNSYALYTTPWNLLIIDEAHRMRNGSGVGNRAVSFLNAKYRLALTGTKIVNAGSDLFNILKFGLCIFQIDWFSLDPNSNYCKDVLDIITLSREKKDIQEVAHFFPKRTRTDEEVIIEWEPGYHKMVYIEVKKSSIQAFKEFDSVKQGLNETSAEYKSRRMTVQQSFFAKTQKLRQTCLHMSLPSLYDPTFVLPDVRWTPSGHFMFSKYQRAQIFTLLCVLRGFGDSELRKRIVSYFANARGIVHPSRKMLYVYYGLMKVFPDDKIVIFSSYRVFLEKLMGPWLDQLGITWTLFCGGSRQAQQEALKNFANVRALLVVKTAGSEGLNLTLGNVCVIMDPHFNNALDEQAAQRVERIGQTKQVVIRKLFMEGSIDMAMKRLQREKEDNIEAWKGKDEKRSLHSQGLYLEREDTVS